MGVSQTIASAYRKRLETRAVMAVRRRAAVEASVADYEVGPTRDYREPPTWFHEGQRRGWGSVAKDTVLCAGSQGGKTGAESPWLLREIQRCAPIIRRERGGKFIFAGPTLSLLQQQALTQFQSLFEMDEGLGKLVLSPKPKFTYSHAGMLKTFGFDVDGAVTVHFAYTNDSSNLESMTAFAGVWDEAGQKENKFASYGAYNRRLIAARSMTFESVLGYAPDWWVERFYNVEGPDATFGRRLWGTTPYEWNWFKTEVYDKAEAERDGFALYNWPSWLNPIVSREAVDAELSKMPTWQWQMMYEGMFTKPAGVIYDTFEYNRDTCEDRPIPATWPIYPGVDFGLINMGGVLVAEDPDTKQLYVIREYHAGRQRTHEEHVEGIRGPYKVMVGAGGAHGESDGREAFKKNGLPIDEPPINDVAIGISCVYEQIKTHKLQIFQSCRGLIGDMQNYAHEIGQDGLPTDAIASKAKWHRLDALRYIVSKLRPNRNIPVPAYSAPATTSLPVGALGAPAMASAYPNAPAVQQDAQGRFIPPPRVRPGAY